MSEGPGEGLIVCVEEWGRGREVRKCREDKMKGGVGGCVCVCVWKGRGRKEGGEGGEVV